METEYRPNVAASLEVRRQMARDRRADVAILVKRGVHPRDIAERLGVAERTIWRDLDALGIKVPRR